MSTHVLHCIIETSKSFLNINHNADIMDILYVLLFYLQSFMLMFYTKYKKMSSFTSKDNKTFKSQYR